MGRLLRRGFLELCEESLKIISAAYQVYSVSGVSFPVGKRFYPSGHSHTIVFGPDYGRVRSLTALEAWPLQGGSVKTFPDTNVKGRELEMLFTAPAALKVLLTGRGLGSLIHFEPASSRTGGLPLYRNRTSPLNSLLDMPAGPRYTREESISRHMSRLLRHGPNAREAALPLNLEDGGSIYVSALLNHPTFA